jgi:hypothetical protein
MNTLRFSILSLCSLFVVACAGASAEPGKQVGQLSAGLGGSMTDHDVTSILYKVVGKEKSCTSDAIATTTVKLEQEAFPARLGTDGTGEKHSFADGLFVLASGEYRVCAFPLRENGKASEDCGLAQTTATVFDERTTEVIMVSQCKGDPNGALDAVTVLNDPPQIDDLDIYPSKFITTCETATIEVKASDVNKDALRYEWSKVSGVDGKLIAHDATAKFSTHVAGDYELRVKVSDVLGASTSLKFPIHVSAATCSDSDSAPE